MTSQKDDTPRLLASTDPSSYPPTTILNSHKVPNSFRPLHLSADGTTIVTTSEDAHIRTFVLPPDLLASPTLLDLTPYTTSPKTPTHTICLAPYFSLSHASTTHLLVSRPDLPLRLTNALDYTHTHASYPLIHGPTERYLTPHSLVFSPDGTGFVAGHKQALSFFEVVRDGEGPVATISTAGAGMGVRGLVMAMDICAKSGVLAVGSSGGQVGVYEAGGRGGEVLVFEAEEGEGAKGRGVVQVKWVRGGRYLLVGQRGSDGIGVYDVRRGRRACWLKGRRAGLMMRMGFDVVESEEGVDVWAGGTDGAVRVWKDVTSREGTTEADVQWKAHGDVVSSVIVHPTGSVAITSSGSRKDVREDDEEEDGSGLHDTPESDVSINVWAL
ncbi:hypothetical protein CAC42_6277 [Sphaceloma murrayae]|uniref:Uncharacterized protein n=1 Tax=Sphaceloma murrayae TaxID=2082308 RepID=A0A2K1QU19_9PEZI|nr:hypothetical protein CAC42_6277 [Sphaceloma murrayae]